MKDVKYYMIFLNSAINPIVYGFGNGTMQKAFRLTFPFLFKGQVPRKQQKYQKYSDVFAA